MPPRGPPLPGFEFQAPSCSPNLGHTARHSDRHLPPCSCQHLSWDTVVSTLETNSTSNSTLGYPLLWGIVLVSICCSNKQPQSLATGSVCFWLTALAPDAALWALTSEGPAASQGLLEHLFAWRALQPEGRTQRADGFGWGAATSRRPKPSGLVRLHSSGVREAGREGGSDTGCPREHRPLPTPWRSSLPLRPVPSSGE